MTVMMKFLHCFVLSDQRILPFLYLKTINILQSSWKLLDQRIMLWLFLPTLHGIILKLVGSHKRFLNITTATSPTAWVARGTYGSMTDCPWSAQLHCRIWNFRRRQQSSSSLTSSSSSVVLSVGQVVVPSEVMVSNRWWEEYRETSLCDVCISPDTIVETNCGSIGRNNNPK